MSHNIRQKLQGIQSSLKAPKGQTNKFGGYKYRSCEDILTAVKPLLAEWGCSIVIQDDIVEVGGRVYVKATASLADNDTELAVSATAFAREAEVKKGMDDAQITATNDHGKRVPRNKDVVFDDMQKKHDAQQGGF
jgi:hypothetical protein